MSEYRENTQKRHPPTAKLIRPLILLLLLLPYRRDNRLPLTDAGFQRITLWTPKFRATSASLCGVVAVETEDLRIFFDLTLSQFRPVTYKSKNARPEPMVEEHGMLDRRVILPMFK